MPVLGLGDAFQVSLDNSRATFSFDNIYVLDALLLQLPSDE
jgi:hypothetical protein